MMLKNQKVWIITDIADCSSPLDLSPKNDGPTVSYFTNDISEGNLDELGIDCLTVT